MEHNITPDMALMRSEDLSALVTEARRAGMAAGYQEGVRDGLERAIAECQSVHDEPAWAEDSAGEFAQYAVARATAAIRAVLDSMDPRQEGLL